MIFLQALGFCVCFWFHLILAAVKRLVIFRFHKRILLFFGTDGVYIVFCTIICIGSDIPVVLCDWDAVKDIILS